MSQAQFPYEQSHTGGFQRQDDAFRHLTTNAEADRFHLYISLACPWASRTLIVRNLKGLEDVVGLTIVDPVRDERGWAFRDPNAQDDRSTDPANGFRFLSEAYKATDPAFAGRVTVPVLWDRKTRRIVNNSEDDICRMFNDTFDTLSTRKLDLFPASIAEEQARLSGYVYDKINNGVYKAGFATKQLPYEQACRELFVALDHFEARLASTRYLFGDRIVETDWRLFCTLVRFDAVYYTHFKCNLRRVVDYPHRQGYLKDLYQQPGIAETVNFDHIKRHYYITHTELNPCQIVPLGPQLDLTSPPGRERLSAH